MNTSKPKISFEFFPPKTEALEEALLKATTKLAPLNPRFVSVTYGASGSTRDRTHKIISRLQSEFKLPIAAHLTCVGATRSEIDAIAKRYWSLGITHIVALRGDPQDGANKYKPHPDGYDYAVDLVKGLKQIANFEISVAAYPETHPEAISPEADLDNLKRKMNAGASRAITQFFLDTEAFLRFRERARKTEISFPLIPGILPISNFARAAEFAAKCGAHVPPALAARFDGVEAGTAEYQNICLDVCREQIDHLRREGVNDFHFYTLNRADLVLPLCEQLMGSGNSIEKEAHG